MQKALQLYHILSESNTNLRQPVGLENQLMQNDKDSEVGRSMLQLLQVSSPVLCSAVLCCTMLCCAMLCCVVLWFIKPA